MLKGKIAFITGASGGIGKEIAYILARSSCNLILVARNIDKLNKIRIDIETKYRVDVYCASLDVRDKLQVNKLIEDLPDEWRNIDYLINNAGLALGVEKMQNGILEDWDSMIDTNIKGVLYLSRAILPLMIAKPEKNENDKYEELPPHIINIGSTAGIFPYPGGAVYSATKSALKFLTDGLRMDLVDKKIKVSLIQPGTTETNFSKVRFHGDEIKAAKVYKDFIALQPEDVAKTVLYVISTPAHVQICEITMTSIHQATGGIRYSKK